MKVVVHYGCVPAELTIADDRLVAACRSANAPVNDVAAALCAALETPFGYPPLRRALTPDDHVAIVVDETVPHLPELLVPTLEHVVGAGVMPDAVTLLCQPSGSQQPWLEELPEQLEDVHLEVHDPNDRKRLSYLATMKKGRRLYLNRTLVDADQVVVLSGRRYNVLHGYGGAEGVIFPALSDGATLQEFDSQVNLALPTTKPWPVRAEAIEAAWLLGVPFFVQAIEGVGDTIERVVAGSAEATAEGAGQQDRRWRHAVPREADIVVATLSGLPERHSFADLAAAAATAARVVRSNGRIVILSEAAPVLGAGEVLLREAGEAQVAVERLRKKPTQELAPALRWAQAAQHARIYLLGGIPADTAEELFATPIESIAQVQRLLDAGGSCTVLEDAHKTLAVIENT